MTITELCKKAHKTALDKGFWEKNSDGSLKERNIPEMLMLVVSELGEACEALRKGIRQNILPNCYIRDWSKDTFEDEIADVFIRLADTCQALGIDLEWQIKKKMEYNQSRPYKHGKKF